jgi:hypothetical protein
MRGRTGQPAGTKMSGPASQLSDTDGHGQIKWRAALRQQRYAQRADKPMPRQFTLSEMRADSFSCKRTSCVSGASYHFVSSKFLASSFFFSFWTSLTCLLAYLLPRPTGAHQIRSDYVDGALFPDRPPAPGCHWPALV